MGLNNPIILPYYLEFCNFLRVFGVDFTLPEPSQFGHRFLKSPLPVAPEPWHTEQVTIQFSARSYNLLGINSTSFECPI